MNSNLLPALNAAAAAIGMDPTWLQNVITLESGWDPQAMNASTGAVGLIQFMPRTLKGMGLLSATVADKVPATGPVPSEAKDAVADEFFAKYPTAESQLAGPVVQYLKTWKPYPTEQSAYLAVFYPAYRFVSPDTLFPANVQAQNPGIDTVQSYVDLVKKKVQTSAVLEAALPIGGLLTIAALSYYLSRKR